MAGAKAALHHRATRTDDLYKAIGGLHLAAAGTVFTITLNALQCGADITVKLALIAHMCLMTW
jgi:hypothetical protein